MSEVCVLPDLPRLAGLMARAATTSFSRPGIEQGLPDRCVIVLDHRQDPARLAAYDQVTGFGLRDQVPATWLHVLTFPLHAHLMSERDFPFPLAGIVHVTNETTLHRPVSVAEGLRISVRAADPKPHKRGVTFNLLGEVHVNDELVWSGRSTYLSMRHSLAGEPERTARCEVPSVAPSQLWRLPADLGRRYATVSGDTNPIHLYPLTARLFGFKRPIIHGMWTHARALAALVPRLPEAYAVKVAFTKPIMLPGRATFAAEPVGDAWRFAVLNSDGTKPYLVGQVTTSASSQVLCGNDDLHQSGAVLPACPR